MKRSHSCDDEDDDITHYNYNGDDVRLSGDYDEIKQSNDQNKSEIYLNGSSKENDANGSFGETNRIEQMEYENYSLRKRCKRLEGIVTQLLQTKGKSDNIPETSEGRNDEMKRHRDDYALHIKPSYEPHYQRRSASPRYREQSPRIIATPVNKPLPIKAYSDSYPDSSNSHSVDVSDPEIRHIGDAYTNPRPLTQVHIPAYKRKEYPTESRKSPLLSQHPYSVKIDTSHIKLERSSVSPKEEIGDKNKENADGISPEEMEQRNEMFRSTYYAHHETSRNYGHRESHKYNSVGTISYDRSRKHSPPYRTRELIPGERFRNDRDTSPSLLTTPYHRRQYAYDPLKAERERKELDENYRPDLLRIASHSSHREIRDESRNFYNKLSINKSKETRISPPIKTRNIQFTDLPHRAPIEPYITAMPGPRTQLSPDPEFNKYNSDFYTKLPPKLHIVESQNENGVTITWNATSNCDSSLVKSYQLFARELFGHKVGTMKRIGIIDALPLPMSCNIDKLKYNIKYKFAVCAVDIYGRFGKMSNFTGKFELKPKGPIQHNQEGNIELEIIM